MDEDIWGPNPQEFIPERWSDISDSQRKTFMPFGNRPFICPAAQTFAPRAIALIVGMLLAAFEDDHWIRICDEDTENEIKGHARLGSERDRYTDIVLRRHSS